MFDVQQLISDTNIEPRAYQERIVTKVFDLYKKKKLRSILIESPTGSGKTVMALLLAKAMHEHLGMKVGWVAMRRHLLSQAQNENLAKRFNVPLKFISMFDKEPPKGLDMLVVDEAQHDVTGSMGHIHGVIKPTHILGMTATPFRADRVKLCFDTVVKDAGIATLIKDGYLSAYHHYTIPDWKVETVTAFYINERERWGKSLIYFHRLVDCFEAERLLLGAGVTCEVVHGGSDTERQLQLFQQGDIQVLINCQKLTEGFDSPDLKTVFCRPSCKSVTIQMAGRVLRKHPEHAFKQIVQTDKTPYPFPKTALPLIQHIRIGEDWRTLQVNDKIDEVNRRTVLSLVRITSEMPAFITKGKEKGHRFGRRAQGSRGAARAPLTPEQRQNIRDSHLDALGNDSGAHIIAPAPPAADFRNAD